MNTVNNNSNVNFGIAFKVYSKNGVRTADLVDAKEELALYKNLTKKLKADKFIRTDLGIKSADTEIVNRDFYNKKALTIKDSQGEHYCDNTFFLSNNGLKKAFGKLRAVYEGITKNSK